MPDRKLLILGGTAEAAGLAEAAVARFGDRLLVISSLAGRTARPAIPPGEVRIGGFGGAEGLARYLADNRIDAVIDATHPFARQISANAARATEATGTKRLTLARPPWPRHPLDRWIEVSDIAGAAQILRRSAAGSGSPSAPTSSPPLPISPISGSWCGSSTARQRRRRWARMRS